MLKAHKERRRRLQSMTWIGLPVVLIGGWFYPVFGFFLLICMGGAALIALMRGRAWCDWMCPRGSAYDLFLKKASRGRDVPELLKSMRFRAALFSVLIAVLGSQVAMAWGSLHEVGLAMVRLLTVTTSAGILLGVFYNERAWCTICPMGTLGNLIGREKAPITIDEDKCTSCKLCAKQCPMRLAPHSYKDAGVLGDADCIKCETCVAACPKNALEMKKAA
jgi:polyferredoxin